MENKYSTDYVILPGVCDSSGALGIPDTFTIFMDLAAIHAEHLRVDTPRLLHRNLFWLAVRTRVSFLRRPKMAESVTLTTWPEKPGRLRADRSYVIEQNGERVVTGKTEWTVLETDTNRLHPVARIFPEGFAFLPDTVWPEPFTRMKEEPLEEYARYTVRSTDIDIGRHMNNAAYLRALAGTFSTERWQGMDIRELEIAYRAPCYEGDTLIWQKREEGDTLTLRAALPEGKTIAQVRIVRGAVSE